MPVPVWTELMTAIAPTAAGAWTEYDATTALAIPTGVVLEVCIANANAAVTPIVGLREGGSALERLVTLHEAEPSGSTHITMMVKVSPLTGYIEYNVSQLDGVSFYVLGYWENVDYIELADSITISTSGTWVEQDLNTLYNIPKERTVNVWVSNAIQDQANRAGARTSNSKLSRYISIHEAEGGGNNGFTFMVQTFGGKIEVYSEADATFYILGYFGYQLEFVEKWQHISIPTYLHDYFGGVVLTPYLDELPDRWVHLVVGINSRFASRYIGARAYESIIDRKLNEHEAEANGNTGFSLTVETDVSGKIRIYCETSTADYLYYLAGYFKHSTVLPIYYGPMRAGVLAAIAPAARAPFAQSFVLPFTKTITGVIFRGQPLGVCEVMVSIRSDLDGSNIVSSTYTKSGGEAMKWHSLTFGESKPLEEGHQYYFVMESLSGAFFDCQINKWERGGAYDYPENKLNTTVIYDKTGSSWDVYSEVGDFVNFILLFSDGTSYGYPYIYQSSSTIRSDAPNDNSLRQLFTPVTAVALKSLLVVASSVKTPADLIITLRNETDSVDVATITATATSFPNYLVGVTPTKLVTLNFDSMVELFAGKQYSLTFSGGTDDDDCYYIEKRIANYLSDVSVLVTPYKWGGEDAKMQQYSAAGGWVDDVLFLGDCMFCFEISPRKNKRLIAVGSGI